jgi:feruloyl-CoA synthase
LPTKRETGVDMAAAGGRGTASAFSNSPCDVERLPGGNLVLRSSLPLAPYPDSVIAALKARAELSGDQVLFRESDAGGITGELSCRDAYLFARKIGRIYLELGASEQRPVALIAENSIKTAIAILGCYAAGVPVAPISPSYSKLSSDYGKLRYIIGLLTPSLVIVDDGAEHAGAIASVDWGEARLAAMNRPTPNALSWEELLAGKPINPDLTGSPDRVAKVLFTSGSTGMPKGVINTQRMMMSNQVALAQVWPGIFDKPPILVDWLPWNHTYGGNQIFNMPIVFGGSLTIDRGRPTPAGIVTMIASITRIRPNLYLNVPRVLDLLADHLEADSSFAEAMFDRLELIGYAGAALPVPVAQKLSRIANRIKGRSIPVVGLWGSTETAPVVTAVYFPSSEPANIGLPIPGFDLKFTPDGTKHEMRVRGPGVTPGYWRQPEVTAKAFDDEGYYRMGDAGRFVDSADINAGLIFDGRVAENFKLLSGTWVNVGSLRVSVIAACVDLIADVVIAGHNQDYVSALIFPKFGACRELAGAEIDDPSCDYLTHPSVQDAIRVALASHNRNAGGSSNRIVRALILHDPPSVDAGEITDKGYINQRAVLGRRARLVDMVYEPLPRAAVINIDPAAVSHPRTLAS